jgi:hypothetical protein
VFVRIARFEGGDVSKIDDGIAMVRSSMDSGDVPPGLEDARRTMMLVDRKTGAALGLTFFDDEDALRRGDEALNAMTPPADMSGGRVSVETFEVAIDRELAGQRAG